MNPFFAFQKKPFCCILNNILECGLSNSLSFCKLLSRHLHVQYAKSLFKITSLSDAIETANKITHLFPAAEGRVHVTELVLTEESPATGQQLQDLSLPKDSLVAAIIRGEEVIVPGGTSQLQAADHLILIALPEHQEEALLTLTGEGA